MPTKTRTETTSEILHTITISNLKESTRHQLNTTDESLAGLKQLLSIDYSFCRNDKAWELVIIVEQAFVAIGLIRILFRGFSPLEYVRYSICTLKTFHLFISQALDSDSQKFLEYVPSYTCKHVAFYLLISPVLVSEWSITLQICSRCAILSFRIIRRHYVYNKNTM
ncbi:hypothetical protein JTB14_009579 [Gonioctena quinquepunctata]|nr:hypothetical protein JTB14_009579 [Gonioctena quinquepunctata]